MEFDLPVFVFHLLFPGMNVAFFSERSDSNDFVLFLVDANRATERKECGEETAQRKHWLQSMKWTPIELAG